MKGKFLPTYLFILIADLALADVPQAPFHRGMNLANWFENFSSISEIHFKLYTKKDFENIKSLGCDHIRLPLELFDMTGPAPDYTLDPLLFIFLDQIIDWSEELDLYLILDNHSWDPDSVTDPDIKDQLLAVWKQLADRYKDRSNLICYEILNEPHGIADAVWHNIQQQAIDTIRAYDQTHTLIVGPANWNSYNNLKYMPEFTGENLIYTFHFYEPHVFTHQGAAWNIPSMENLGGVPYPYDAARMPDLPEELKGTWVEDRYNAYPIEGNDTWVRSQIDIAIQFMNERQVPLWCGEFGAYMPNSQTEDRARWLETVRTYLEDNGIAWALFEYGGGFGIFEPGSNQLFEYDVNIPIIEAVGLSVPPQSEYQLIADSTGFTIYDDYIAQHIFNENWLSAGNVNYYSQSNPAEGDFCISWQGSNLYDCLRFRFSPIHDLTLLEENDYLLDMWIRCSTENVKIDVRFEDTDTDDPNDHPWRMRFTVDKSVVNWDGTWQHLQIPLTDFTEQGAWEDNTWYNPQGDFDWSQVEHFVIDAQYHDLNDIELFFDHICINKTDSTGGINDQTNNLAGIPDKFKLFNNYPNPFYLKTKIRYNLPKNTKVKMNVYNIAGRWVKTLIYDDKKAGSYEIIFDGSELPSGIYLYTLEAGKYRDTKKMILLK
jgi:endoglucanase